VGNKVDSGRYGGSSERRLDIFEGWIASVLLKFRQMRGYRTVDDVWSTGCDILDRQRQD
jgi:hypothetical protein